MCRRRCFLRDSPKNLPVLMSETLLVAEAVPENISAHLIPSRDDHVINGNVSVVVVPVWVLF
jgi:hypothetical protein